MTIIFTCKTSRSRLMATWSWSCVETRWSTGSPTLLSTRWDIWVEYNFVDRGMLIDDVPIRNQIRGRTLFVVAITFLNFLSGVFTKTFLRCGTVEIVMETTIKTLWTPSCYQSITISFLRSPQRYSKGQWPISYRTASNTSFKKPSTKWTETTSPTITRTRPSKRFCRASWRSSRSIRVIAVGCCIGAAEKVLPKWQFK